MESQAVLFLVCTEKDDGSGLVCKVATVFVDICVCMKYLYLLTGHPTAKIVSQSENTTLPPPPREKVVKGFESG